MPTDATETQASQDRRNSWIDRSLLALVGASVAVVFAGAIVQVRYGSYEMTLVEVVKTLVNPNLLFDLQTWRAILLGESFPEMSNQSLIVWNIRMPRILVAVFVGANLAVSGAIFQAVTRNELASPYILGVNSGAGFAILLVLILFTGLSAYVPLVAALGGAGAFLLVYAIAWQNGTSPVRLVLAGIIVNTIFNSLQTGLFFFAPSTGAFQNALSWTTGSLTGVDWEQVRVILPWTAATLTLSLAGARQLNVLLLGERTAQSLGMSVERVRFLLSAVAIVGASASVAVAGLVGFVGLVVPHLVRTVVGSDYKRLILGCMFAGPALMVAADVFARLALSPTQVPVGIVTGLLGGPYFLYLMRKHGNLSEF
ncbi:FecCD family ABC transporter permease [Halorussus ruber]|uniref:FecCD family ABC transporter permease n=1 Tax=Halorussus ruber TaxID=1126238 RepID=UPI001093276A|nr:iron ABC transporter permease [Halorussus ruber]